MRILVRGDSGGRRVTATLTKKEKTAIYLYANDLETSVSELLREGFLKLIPELEARAKTLNAKQRAPSV